MLLLKGENKRQSLILRTCSLLLAIIMVVSIAVPPVQAEDAGKKSGQSADTEAKVSDTVTSTLEATSTSDTKPDETTTLQKLETMMGVEFKPETIHEVIRKEVQEEIDAGRLTEADITHECDHYETYDEKKECLSDEKFVNAIYKSINNAQNEFMNNVDEEAKKVNQGDTVAAIKVILGNFMGDINARKHGINHIWGIKMLRKAEKIDVSNNNITSLKPLGVPGKEQADVTKPEAKWFGEEHRSVQIDFTENKYREVPLYIGGRITPIWNDTKSIMLPEFELRFLAPDTLKDGISTGEIDLIATQNGEPTFPNNNGIVIAKDNQLQGIEIEETYIHTKTDHFVINGIKQTGETGVAWAVDSLTDVTAKEMRSGLYYVEASDQSTSATSSRHIAWCRLGDVQIYTSLNVSGDANGKIKVVKKDKRTGEKLAGAEFTVYDEKGNEIKTGETDKDGEVVFDKLNPGTYTVEETKAPDGYKLPDDPEDRKKTFVIEDIKGDYSIVANEAVRGVSTEKGDSIELSDDGKSKVTETIGKGGIFVASGKANVGLTVKEGGKSKLSSLTVTWTEGIAQSGSETYVVDVENGENPAAAIAKAKAKMQEATNKNYQNTVVNAEFVNVDKDGKLLKVVFEDPPAGELFISKTVEDPDGIGFDNETEFEFQIDLKDKDNQPLEGEFFYTKTINGKEEKRIYYIESGERVKLKHGEEIHITELPEGTKFVVTELLKDNQDYKVTINGEEIKKVPFSYEGEITESSEGKYIAKVDAVNTIPTYKLSVRKEDSEKNPLEGATFALYKQVEEGGEEASSIPGLEDLEDVRVLKHQENTTKMDDSGNASAVFDKLPSGTTWYLVETRVPTGYQKLNGYIKILIKKENGEVKFTAEDSNWGISAPINVDENGCFYIVVTNKLNINLPRSGRGGVYWYTIIGTLLIAAAAVTGAMSYRRKRNY